MGGRERMHVGAVRVKRAHSLTVHDFIVPGDRSSMLKNGLAQRQCAGEGKAMTLSTTSHTIRALAAQAQTQRYDSTNPDICQNH